jgi:lauroyl/myristoyl acyltransferase
MRDRLILRAFLLAWEWLPKIPESIAKPLAAFVADLAWIGNGKGVRQLQTNLARVTGLQFDETRDLTRRGIRAYAEYWRILFQLERFTAEEREARVILHGFERVDAQVAAGHGVVIAATHSGNWDLAGTVVAGRYNGVTTVAERLKPEALFDAFAALRTKYGLEILPHRGGDRPALDVLRERIEQRRIVALVSDRDLSRRGIDVTFFEARTRMAAGPAALAVSTGAALMPAAVWTEGDLVHVLIHEPVDFDRSAPDAIAIATQRLADVFARDIAAHPTDWHMLQRVWDL